MDSLPISGPSQTLKRMVRVPPGIFLNFYIRAVIGGFIYMIVLGVPAILGHSLKKLFMSGMNRRNFLQDSGSFDPSSRWPINAMFYAAK